MKVMDKHNSFERVSFPIQFFGDASPNTCDKQEAKSDKKGHSQYGSTCTSQGRVPIFKMEIQDGFFPLGVGLPLFNGHDFQTFFYPTFFSFAIDSYIDETDFTLGLSQK